MVNNIIYNELKAIKKIITFCNSKQIEKALTKFIKTNPRKIVWIYIDGTKYQPELAELSGVSQQAVSYFLQEAKLAGLIEYPKGRPPSKVLDYIPPNWFELVGDKISLQAEEEMLQRRTLNDYR